MTSLPLLYVVPLNDLPSFISVGNLTENRVYERNITDGDVICVSSGDDFFIRFFSIRGSVLPVTEQNGWVKNEVFVDIERTKKILTNVDDFFSRVTQRFLQLHLDVFATCEYPFTRNPTTFPVVNENWSHYTSRHRICDPDAFSEVTVWFSRRLRDCYTLRDPHREEPADLYKKIELHRASKRKPTRSLIIACKTQKLLDGLFDVRVQVPEPMWWFYCNDVSFDDLELGFAYIINGPCDLMEELWERAFQSFSVVTKFPVFMELSGYEEQFDSERNDAEKGETIYRHRSLTAHLRTYTQHTQILEACIGLSALHLPVYVLLEIVDWLPFMHEPGFSRFEKVKLLESIRASITKLSPLEIEQ